MQILQLKFPEIMDDYCKLRSFALQVTAALKTITNYVKIYYKLRQVLQIVALLQIAS